MVKAPCPMLRARLTMLLLALASLATPRSAGASSPYLVIPPIEVVRASAAYRYANMSNAEALAELDRRQVAYRRVQSAPGVRCPIRLTGPLRGVSIHSSLPPAKRATTPFEILDARLALSLDDFSALLARHDIVEVVHYTMYRPNVAKTKAKKKKFFQKVIRNGN